MRRERFAVSIFVLCLIRGAAAQQVALNLAPIVKEGTPADLLMEDPVIPAQTVTREASGSGTIEHSFTNQIPLPTQDMGQPGGLAQYRGLGLSAEDINVQALGVPLNPPQGGGLNLSVFPQFLWSDFRVQQGPSFGGSDPRGASGSVTLVPWSASVLRAQGTSARAGASYSDAATGQLWAAGRHSWGTGAIALAQGFTSGVSQGPSGSLSVREDFGEVTGSFHLLATDIDAESPGSASSPTPLARLRTQRWLPVLQADVRLPEGGMLKSSVYYDGGILRYFDSESGFRTHDRVEQAGFDNALLLGDWKLGIGARRTHYEQLGFIPPDESALNLQATYSYEHDDWLLEPTLLLAAVSRFGAMPQGSVGLRRQLEARGHAVFGRASFSRRLPSLADRYYVDPFFVPNPELAAERDWTLQFGFESRQGLWRHSLQAYGQLRDDSQALVDLTGGVVSVANLGQATVGSIMDYFSWGEEQGWAFSNAVSFNASRRSASGLEFPFLPRWIDLLSLRWNSTAQLGRKSIWGAQVQLRLSDSSATQTVGSRVAGYGALDLSGRVELAHSLSLTARVDNVGDRRYETSPGFSNRGRTFLLQLSGEI